MPELNSFCFFKRFVMDNMNLSGKEIVIFDSNAYRNFTTGKTSEQIGKDILEVVKLESQNNLVSLISPIVLCELLAHLADSTDNSFDKCLKAVKALYMHNGDKYQFRTLADPELLLCQSFFQKSIKSREDFVENIGKIAYDISQNPSIGTTEKYKPMLKEIREHVFQTEMNFATDIQNLIKQMDTSSTNWQLFANDPKKRVDFINYLRSDDFKINVSVSVMIRTYLLLVKHNLEVFDPGINLVPRAKDFAIQFNAYIELYKEVYMRLVGSDYNLFDDSRVNFIWDINLMLSVGDQKIQNNQLMFVTHDKAMLKAADAAGHKYKILTLVEYLEYIGFEK